MAAVAEALCVGKTNVCPEEMSIPERTKCCPFRDGSNAYNRPAVRYLADDPGKWRHMGDSVLASAAGRWGTEPWLEPGQPW